MPAVIHSIPGLTLIDHTFTVPLDHQRPKGEQISIFARGVSAPNARPDLPWLVFFQGGPGGKSPRPMGATGWIGRAVKDYRVLLLDQRGTGRSTPITAQTLPWRGDAQAQADYLKLFRADAIVRDAEIIRKTLLGPDERWSILGQSYGGFCSTTYLSLAPEGLREAYITGGLPPVHLNDPDGVYRATYKRVLGKNRHYFARYPDDADRAATILAHLAKKKVKLPDGSPLTPRRFQELGGIFGASDGFEFVHYLLEEAFVSGPRGLELSETFLLNALLSLTHADHPLHAILQEGCYTQGAASRWSALRIRAEFPEFEPSPDNPPLFVGEMMYPWMFEEDRGLAPMREAAEIVAQYEDWPVLYDIEQLRANSVPVAAAVYYDDMYVERALSEETAATIKSCRTWVTSEYEHNALRAHGEVVLGHLMDMLHGEA
jgi:pimeloyl-ACP methyl ester carboxylesterase